MWISTAVDGHINPSFPALSLVRSKHAYVPHHFLLYLCVCVYVSPTENDIAHDEEHSTDDV